MSLTEAAARAAERAPIPDVLTKIGVGYMVARARRKLEAEPPANESQFAREMTDFPIAVHTDAARGVPAEPVPP